MLCTVDFKKSNPFQQPTTRQKKARRIGRAGGDAALGSRRAQHVKWVGAHQEEQKRENSLRKAAQVQAIQLAAQTLSKPQNKPLPSIDFQNPRTTQIDRARCCPCQSHRHLGIRSLDRPWLLRVVRANLTDWIAALAGAIRNGHITCRKRSATRLPSPFRDQFDFFRRHFFELEVVRGLKFLIFVTPQRVVILSKCTCCKQAGSGSKKNAFFHIR